MVSKASNALDEAIDQAWAECRTSCLWNLRRPRDANGVRTLVKALRANGDMRAWNLATKISRLAKETGNGSR